ncbi:RbsD/FucU family protein [Skermanella sp. TT6]|nr:RbsD/FucU domain-containing protein [Skermanella sp. TT6]
MPPAAIAPVEPMRNLKEARQRHAAAVERNSRCLKLILGRHKDDKDLKARIESSDDAHLFFDADTGPGRATSAPFRRLTVMRPSRPAAPILPETGATMLKGLDPLLHADLLYVLAAMGHGDELALVDRNFPAVSLGARVIRLDGADAPRALEAILSVMPLDDMLDTPYTRMVDLSIGEAEESEICRQFVDVVERFEGPRWTIGQIDRFGFYDRARAAFAVVVTGETRVNGCLLLAKGIVRPAQPVPDRTSSGSGESGARSYSRPDLQGESSSRERPVPVS